MQQRKLHVNAPWIQARAIANKLLLVEKMGKTTL